MVWGLIIPALRKYSVEMIRSLDIALCAKMFIKELCLIAKKILEIVLIPQVIKTQINCDISMLVY